MVRQSCKFVKKHTMVSFQGTVCCLAITCHHRVYTKNISNKLKPV